MKAKAVVCVLVLGAAIVAGCSKAKERPGVVPAVAWGEPMTGLQAGISFEGYADKPVRGVRLGLHIRNAGKKPARLLRLSAAKDYWPPPPLEVRVGGKGRRYVGEVLDPPPPPSADDYIDLAPGATDSTEITLDPSGWGLEKGANAQVAFVFRRNLAEDIAAPFDPETRSWTKVTGLWTGRARSGAVEIEITAKGGAAAPTAREGAVIEAARACLSKSTGGAIDWKLEARKEGANWIVEVPLGVIKKMPGGFPAVVVVDENMRATTGPEYERLHRGLAALQASRSAVDSLTARLDEFWLALGFPSTKGDNRGYHLTLKVAPTPSTDPDPRYLVVPGIGREQATRIIRHLAESGFFAQAADLSKVDVQAPPGPCFSVHAGIPNGGFLLYMQHNQDALRRLQALRGVLSGRAAEAMDRLLAQLEPRHRESAKVPVAASNVRFLMVPPDGEKRSGLYAIKTPPPKRPLSWPWEFRRAADGTARPPRAGLPVTLVGKLPGHVTTLDFFEAREGSIKGRDIELPARFVEYQGIIKNLPAPRNVYVVATLPVLEAGRYRARITLEQFQYLDPRNRTKIERAPPTEPPRFRPLTCEFEVTAKGGAAAAE